MKDTSVKTNLGAKWCQEGWKAREREKRGNNDKRKVCGDDEILSCLAIECLPASSAAYLKAYKNWCHTSAKKVMMCQD